MLILKISGIVQGVGFRPFVWRVAKRAGVRGFVKNKGGYVEIGILGNERSISIFKDLLTKELPSNAFIDRIEEEVVEDGNYEGFTILASEDTDFKLPSGIPPDIALCNNCLSELFDPSDRRHLYPFINCTDCGPRFTIVTSVPYDRVKTSMHVFKMCEECENEYHDPGDRRYHAEPIACPRNGPQYYLVSREGTELEGDPLKRACDLLDGGHSMAIKGFGGFHLACDASNDDTVMDLRKRLGRPQQPFAIMGRDLSSIENVLELNESESSLLRSPSSPIVVLRKKGDGLFNNVAPGLDTVGVMLPYAPIHHLLFSRLSTPFLVMTSANYPGNPMIIDISDAMVQLPSIDIFLTHDLEIVNRCDDSVIRDNKFIRRSRGYVPLPLECPNKDTTIAFGAEMNNVVAVSRLGRCVLSQHIGDTSNWDVMEYALDALKFLMKISNIDYSDVGYILCDKHPQYNTRIIAREWSKEMALDLVEVQHHFAHSYAIAAEHGAEDVLCVAADGTGYGDDGNIWGGELLYSNRDPTYNKRLGHLEYLRMPGGDLSAKNPLRILIPLLEEGELERYSKHFKGGMDEILSIKKHSLKRSPLSCSTGRLLDSISAMLGVATVRTYEGECPMKLEALAFKGNDLGIDIDLEEGVAVTSEFVRNLYGMMEKNSREDIAKTAHMAIARAFLDMISDYRDLHIPVGFSGGVAINHILSKALRDGVEKMGLRFLEHRKVPPGDGGVSFGQSCIKL